MLSGLKVIKKVNDSLQFA